MIICSASRWHEWAQTSNSCLWDVIPNLLDYQTQLHHGLWKWVTWPHLAISAVPRQCWMGYRAVSTLVKAVYGLYLIWRSPVWGRLRKERRCTITRRSPVWGRLRKERRCTIIKWSLAARRCLFRMGLGYHCGPTIVTDGLNWSQRCLRRTCQSIDAVVPGGSLLRG